MRAQLRIQAFKLPWAIVAGGGEFMLEIKVAVEDSRHSDCSFPDDGLVQMFRDG